MENNKVTYASMVRSANPFDNGSPHLKKVMMRLGRDHQEIIDSPVPNVSAAPLESNMLEWHCNIHHDGNIYHLILFFPEKYPCVSVSAEFVPHGFRAVGAFQEGKKGTRICLSIFSDFDEYHPEWKAERKIGWSPGYSVQTILLNVVSYLSSLDRNNNTDIYHEMCRSFVCEDCGHSAETPYPTLIKVDPEKNDGKNNGYLDLDTGSQHANGHPDRNSADPDLCDPFRIFSSRIVDYMSKLVFSLEKPVSISHLFGYGIALSGSVSHPFLTSPFEFLTLDSFTFMISSLGEAQSVSREKLSFFLPLYIADNHGSVIREQFEQTMQTMGPVVLPNSDSRSLTDVIIKVLPNLMCGVVVHFSNGKVCASDRSLEGYFALHRLFLWAMDTYPDLKRAVNQRVQDFATNSQARRKDACPNINQWLMLLSVTGQPSWESAAEVYLSERFNRDVMWYLKKKPKLADMDVPMNYRLKRTFDLTIKRLKTLASLVAFLRVAKPQGMSRKDVLTRYADNLGFPTHKMVQELKDFWKLMINKTLCNYDQWYRAIGLSVPSRAELHDQLKESVLFANSTKGYYLVRARTNHRRHFFS